MRRGPRHGHLPVAASTTVVRLFGRRHGGRAKRAGGVRSTERVHLVKDLGVTVLVFAIGLEFDLRGLIRLAPTAGVVALIQFAAMVGLGYLVGHLMGWTSWESLFTGAILSISGIVIIAKAFEETRVDPRVRELVFGVVLCERRDRDLTHGGVDHDSERRRGVDSRVVDRR